MDTDSLRVFVIAAETLNISEAGRQLGIAPAVAGARLAKLEKSLAADLLHRSTRKVSLSVEGAEFLPYAKEILAQEQAAYAALGHQSVEVKGTIRFAASSTFAQLYLMPVLPDFLREYPLIDVELRLSDSKVPLIDGGFDLALRNYAIEDSTLIGRRLADDTRILCASPNYLRAHGRPSAPEELQTHQLLTFAGATPRKLTAKGDGRSCTFPPPGVKPRVVCDDGASLRIAATSGAGICMSSLWNVHSELKDGRLERVLPEFEVDDGSAIWIVYPKSNALTAKVRTLIDFLIERLRPLLQ
ncbi:MAG: LysR substrate-binding domain-containing protein [Pseudomonadota bacterium]